MTVPRPRPGLTRALAAVAAALFGLVFFGLIDLLVVPLHTPGFYPAYLIETGWGLLFLVLVAAPFAAAAVRPSVTAVAATQALAVALAVAAAAVLAGYPRQLWPALVLGLAGAAVGRAAGLRPDPAGWRLDLPLALLALPAVAGGAVYAWSQAHGWRGLDSDITLGLDHRPMQAALGLAVPLVAALAALAVGSGLPGRRVPVWTVAVTAAWLGVVSLAYPAHSSSLGTGPGAVAVAWGVAFAVTAEVRVAGRRTRGR